ncbi:MAG: serine/threonine-protein kinase [Myxococcota bacterium]
MSERFPKAFGRYWLQEKIGHGGMAEVFRATVGPDPETYAFDIALKRLHPHLEHDQSQVDMFMTEADIAKFLKHANIVQVYESGLIEGHAYIAMEYVWGLDLAQVLLRLRQRQLRLPEDLAVHITLQVLRALDYVHRASAPGGEPMNLVHRDVTPSNIYLTYDGQVKLADFGVARVSFLEGHDERRTLKGKVSYMPPEALAGGETEPGVDLWAISVTLYEMLTMQPVYEGLSETDILAGTAVPSIVPAERVVPELDLPLAKILRRALHKKRRRRPEDAVDLYRMLKGYLEATGVVADQDALGRFLRDAVGVDTPALPALRAGGATGSFLASDYRAPIEMSPTQRLQLAARRRNGLAPALVAAGVLAAAGVGYWLLSGDEKPAPPTVAEAPADPKTEEPAPKPDPAKVAADPEPKPEPVPPKKKKRRRRRRN